MVVAFGCPNIVAATTYGAMAISRLAFGRSGGCRRQSEVNDAGKIQRNDETAAPIPSIIERC